MLDTIPEKNDAAVRGFLSVFGSPPCTEALLKSASSHLLAINTALEQDTFSGQPVAVIFKGTIGLQHVLSDQRRSISTIFLSGDLLDLRYMKTNGGGFVCLTEVELCLFEADVFEKLRLEHPNIQAAITASHYRQCSIIAAHCADIARKSAVEKLASFIFECRDRQVENVQKNVIALPLKRIDIADYMGLRPETLSRAFSRLRMLGLIAIDDVDNIRILNERALRRTADGNPVEPL